MTFASQRTLIELVMWKILFGNFSRERPRFHAISHLKLEAKEIFL